MVRKAIVLAAGFGTRLRPLTLHTPKPLLPVWGEPMLSRIVDMLREWGVDDIVVNCHYLHGQIEAWCAANGCRASYEPEILGTGGVVNPLREWIGEDDFYLVNGDIVVDGAEPPERDPKNPDEIGCCLITEAGPRTIEVEPESGFVTNWRSDEAGYSGTFTYCGIARLSAKVLDYVAPTGASTIVTAYEKAAMDGKFIRAIRPDELLWTDAGTIADFMEVNRDGDDNAFGDLPQLQAAHAEKVEFLGARGSNRMFFKAADDGRIVIIYDDAKRGENARYAGHARFLKLQGVPVPEVLADLTDLKTLVIANAGSERRMSLDEYAKVVKELEHFNRLGSLWSTEPQDPQLPGLEPPFDAELWRWERELFTEHCLGRRYQRELPAAAAAELEKVAELLEHEPKALVHRDFQSTNVLWRNDRPTFIDFQGMRMGPAAYDLASLVYDPYVRLGATERTALIALYAKLADRPGLPKVVPYAAVQRLVQCLGAYGRLASVGQPQFGQYVLPALENLLTVADEAGLDAVGALAEDLIAVENHRHEHHHAN